LFDPVTRQGRIIGHYDDPPPDRIDGPSDLEQLRDADRFREANLLHAWIEVEDGSIVDSGYFGGGLVGSMHELVGASPFPRHWVYGSDGTLAQKSGTVDFKTWYRESHGENTPWGDAGSPALVAAA
jgi:hypothetical protein